MSLTFWVLVSVALSSCSFQQKPPTSDGGQLQLAFPDGTAGIRSLREVYSSLSEMTGVPESNTITNAVFRATRPRLSSDGVSDTVSAVTVSASGIMAAGFCQELYRAERLLTSETRTFYRNVDLTKGPSFIAAETRLAIARTLARSFWRRDATENELKILTDLMAEVVLGEANSSGMTESMLLFACTAAGSSPDAISN